MKKIYYFKSFNDDLITSNNQKYELKENYKWVHENKFYNFISNIVYKIVVFFGKIYCKIFLNTTIINNEILEKYKNTGYFVYGNHTQPVGDVFIPAIVCKNKRIYTIGSPANFGIPVIGKILPMLGIIPTSENITLTKKLYKTVKKRVEEKSPIIIYPEAHVWKYYTRIRSFTNTSFKFPVDFKVPSFCITTTYYKKRFGRKPGIKVFVDGPFVTNEKLNKKQNQDKICREVYECMKERSKESNYEYIKYVQLEKESQN